MFCLTHRPSARRHLSELSLSLSKAVIGVAEEDQAENGDRILGGLRLRVGSQFVGCVPEATLDLGGLAVIGAEVRVSVSCSSLLVNAAESGKRE